MYCVVLGLASLAQAATPSGSQAQAEAPNTSQGAGPFSPFPAGYLDHQALSARLKQVAAEKPEAVQLLELATSGEGREVWLVTLPGTGGKEKLGTRPAILIVANLEADHLIGSQVALGLIEQLTAVDKPENHGLAGCDLYIVPRLNPDGAELLLKAPARPVRTNLHPVDRDRDGQAGEDGPDDLDGDGLITRIRVRDLAASLVADEKDPRYSRPAVAADGETGLFSEYLEGLDDDDDGSLNEDPAGGVNLNRNWPRLWPEFQVEAGETPVSEPETFALMRILIDHPEIAAVWTFSLEDTLRKEPKAPEAPFDSADLPHFVALHHAYLKAIKTLSGLDRPGPVPKDEGHGQALPPAQSGIAAPVSAGELPTLDAQPAGSLAAWAYHQYGAVGFSTRLWPGPDFPETKEGGDKVPESGEPLWLFWNDRVMGGQAFVPYHEFDHPSLGKVSIGGWKPGVRMNPPQERISPLVAAHADFLHVLAERLARLSLPVAEARPLGGGLFEIRAVVQNSGQLPTALAQGVKTQQAPPVLVRLLPGDARIVGGRGLERIDALPAGASREMRWIVQADQPLTRIKLEAACPKAGAAVVEITLK